MLASVQATDGWGPGVGRELVIQAQPKGAGRCLGVGKDQVVEVKPEAEAEASMF